MSHAFITRRGGRGGGEANVSVTIVLKTNGGTGSVIGIQVTITDVDMSTQIDSFTYSGARTLQLPARTHGRIHVGNLQGYLPPDDVDFVAKPDANNTVTVTYIHGTRYGYARAKNTSDPSARITYLYDAVGKTPMHVDLSTGEPNYGGWKDVIDQIVRPVMLWTNGTVAYELDHDDQTKRIDGGPSDVANSAFDGNAMVEFGGAYKWVRRYEDSTTEYVIFSNIQYDSNYHAYAHTNGNGVVKDAFYWGMYDGTYSNSKLRSIGAGTVMNSQTAQVEINRATANGNGYYTIYKSAWDYYCDLLTLIGKSDNTQIVFGAGRCKTSNSGTIAAGTLKAYGPFWGSSNQTSGVKALYVENPWGNIWQRMAGCIHDRTNGFKTKMTPPYNLTADGYNNTGVVILQNGGSMFVVAESITDQGYIPEQVNGSEGTYMCDAIWINTANVGYALIGGMWKNGNVVGSRAMAMDGSASLAQNYVGTRLSYIPT